MKTQPKYRRISRWLYTTLLILASGSTLVLSGCDPQVSSIVLGGFQDLSTTFVDAFFTVLANNVDDGQTTQ